MWGDFAMVAVVSSTITGDYGVDMDAATDVPMANKPEHAALVKNPRAAARTSMRPLLIPANTNTELAELLNICIHNMCLAVYPYGYY